MRVGSIVRSPWAWLAFGMVAVAAALGAVALYPDGDPPAAPGLSVVQRPRGFLYKATTSRFEGELQRAEPEGRSEAADAFASAELQAGAYRYRAAVKEYRRSLKAYPTRAADLNAGLVSLLLGELAAAETHFRSGLERSAEGDYGDFLVAFRLALGAVFWEQGRVDEALAATREALDLARQERDLLSQAAALAQLGNTQAAQGQMDEAIATHEQALDIAERLNHALGQAVALGNLGYVRAEMGLPNEALERHRQAYRLAEERLGTLGQAFALADIGNAYRMRGQIQDALLSLGMAFQFHAELDNNGDQGAAMNDIGRVYFRQGQLDKALAAFEKSYNFYKEIRHPVGQAAALSRIGNVFERQRQLDKALELHERALELDTASGHAVGRARDLGNIGNVYGRQGRMTEALERLRVAEAIYQRVRPQGQGAQDVARTLRRLLEPLDLSAIDD